MGQKVIDLEESNQEATIDSSLGNDEEEEGESDGSDSRHRH